MLCIFVAYSTREKMHVGLETKLRNRKWSFYYIEIVSPRKVCVPPPFSGYKQVNLNTGLLWNIPILLAS